jgi:hypothetical protein
MERRAKAVREMKRNEKDMLGMECRAMVDYSVECLTPPASYKCFQSSHFRRELMEIAHSPSIHPRSVNVKVSDLHQTKNTHHASILTVD